MIRKLLVSVLSCLAIAVFGNTAYADVCANTTTSAIGASYTLTWSNIALGEGLGATGFSQFDSDGDGYTEILFGSGHGFGGNTSYSIVEYEPSGGGYKLLCQSGIYDTSINKIIPFTNDTISSGSVIALADGTIEVIDHGLGSKVQFITTSMTAITDVLVADADNDGQNDIAVLSADQIKLYNANDYSFEKSIAYGGSSFAIGKFTDPSVNDIALNVGYVIELTGDVVAVKWDYTSIGFSNLYLKSGDTDHDGLDELVAADAWYNMRVFNADTQGVLWENSADLDIDTLEVLDVSGDGIPDVVYGDGQWGSVYGLDGATGTLLWSVNNPDHGVTDVLVGDFDKDDALELIWGAGYSSTGPDYLYIQDLSTNTLEWQSSDAGSPYYAIGYGDLDGDKLPDRVYASFDSGSGDGIVTAVKGGTDTILWQTTSSTFGGYAWTGIHDIAVGDVDGDGVVDVVVGTDNLYVGTVYILNGTDGSVKTSVTLENGSPVYSLRIVNLDGETKIFAGGGKEHTGATGIYVYVIDGATATWESTFPSLGNSWTDLWSIEAVDIDNDGTQEIVALWDKTYIIDPDTNGLKATTGTYYSVGKSVDIPSGNNIVYLGGASGEIAKLSADGTTESFATVCDGDVVSLEAINGIKLAFTCGGRLGIYDVITGETTWQTDDLIDINLGIHDRLVFEKISNVNTLTVGGSRVYYFEDTGAVVNTTPIAYDDIYSGHFSEKINGTLRADEPNSLPLSFGLYKQPESGQVEILDSSTGEFDYTPSGDYSGTVTFQYYSSNGTSVSNLATVTVNLTNSAPAGEASSFDAHWNSLYLATLKGLDLDADTLRYEIVSPPAQGTLLLLDDVTGEFSYINSSPDVGSVSFSYRVSDNAEISGDYTVTLNLVNEIPQATQISLETYYSVDISTLLKASDTDGDNLTYELVTGPDVGTATLSQNGLLTYVPEGNESYKAVMTYRVNDGKDWSSTSEIAVSVVGDSAVVSKSGGGGAINIWVLLLFTSLLYSRLYMRKK